MCSGSSLFASPNTQSNAHTEEGQMAPWNLLADSGKGQIFESV